MDLTALRCEIDSIDDELIRLFVKRMDVCAQVADYKKANGLPILMSAREQEKLEDAARKAGPEMAGYTKRLYTLLFELSRDYQHKRTEVTP